MELSREERIRKVVKWLAGERGVNQRDIGQLVGYSNESAFSQVLSGKKPVPDVLLQRLAALDPRVNIDFLTGISDKMRLDQDDKKGNDIQDINPPQSPRVGIFVPPELAQMVTDMTATIREQQSMIRTLVDEWKKERETKL